MSTDQPSVDTSAGELPSSNSITESDDIDLVRRCQNGDNAAFDELVVKYRSRAFASIYHIVHNEQDAWDLAQDGFFKAWKSIGRFRFKSSFYTWLHRILVNVVIDSLRKRQAAGSQEFDDSIPPQDIEPTSDLVPKGEPSPPQKLERQEIRARIDAAINKLSPEHRMVIMLRELEELRYEEIADIMGCSVNTVITRAFYARKKLQNLLRDVYEGMY